MKKNKAIYNRKVKDILKKLKNKESRSKIAKSYNYSSWKSLDIYMRRKGFLYDSIRKTYYNKYQSRKEKEDLKEKNDKINKIRYLFKIKLDPRTIAKKMRFKNNRELAIYMKKNNYFWSSRKNNYFKEETKVKSFRDSFNSLKEDKIQEIELIEFLPFIKRLKANEDKLNELLGIDD